MATSRSCCSPPDMFPASVEPTRLQDREKIVDIIAVCLHPAVRGSCRRPSARFSSTVMTGKLQRALRHEENSSPR